MILIKFGENYTFVLMIKKEELLKLQEICNKATKSPWKTLIEGRDFECGSTFIMTGNENDRDYDIEFIRIKNEDIDFITMARNEMPKLINELLELKK